MLLALVWRLLITLHLGRAAASAICSKLANGKALADHLY
jgi:hypothetical protein